jgi:hypothetical protein
VIQCACHPHQEAQLFFASLLLAGRVILHMERKYSSAENEGHTYIFILRPAQQHIPESRLPHGPSAHNESMCMQNNECENDRSTLHAYMRPIGMHMHSQ